MEGNLAAWLQSAKAISLGSGHASSGVLLVTSAFMAMALVDGAAGHLPAGEHRARPLGTGQEDCAGASKCQTLCGTGDFYVTKWGE